MAQDDLRNIKAAFNQLSAARDHFAQDVGALLNQLEAMSLEIETRADWVEQKLDQLNATDGLLVQRISEEIDRISEGDGDRVASMIEELSARLDLHAEGQATAESVADLKKQNARLAAELKLAKTRAAQLSQTVEQQQISIDREHSLSSELALLRQTLDTHRQLIASVDASELSDDALEEALAELDD